MRNSIRTTYASAAAVAADDGAGDVSLANV
jgi:hypothetical protein